MEQSRVPESPLKDPVGSKPPIVSKSPDPPVKKKPRLDASYQSTHHMSTMDQIDAFPEHISRTAMPVTLPEKPDTLEYAARQGQVRACIIYQEPNTKRGFVLLCKDNR
ncbi:uncharacterized protein TNCV_768571 [Trichonephila clavipes]|nr:uncharacterized protein TNCV_768571 [Trichonephila clavipes]